jgi:hypothetical protein
LEILRKKKIGKMNSIEWLDTGRRGDDDKDGDGVGSRLKGPKPMVFDTQLNRRLANMMLSLPTQNELRKYDEAMAKQDGDPLAYMEKFNENLDEQFKQMELVERELFLHAIDAIENARKQIRQARIDDDGDYDNGNR